jgi:hypothetical protein
MPLLLSRYLFQFVLTFFGALALAVLRADGLSFNVILAIERPPIFIYALLQKP